VGIKKPSETLIEYGLFSTKLLCSSKEGSFFEAYIIDTVLYLKVQHFNLLRIMQHFLITYEGSIK